MKLPKGVEGHHEDGNGGNNKEGNLRDLWMQQLTSQVQFTQMLGMPGPGVQFTSVDHRKREHEKETHVVHTSQYVFNSFRLAK